MPPRAPANIRPIAEILPVGPAAIRLGARLIRAGRLVALPTETVYGLGADATNDAAVAAIFAAKGRPRFNPLIVHVASAAAAWRLVRADARARALGRAFWPGPLTLVLPRRPGSPVSWLASAGLDTLAVRVPGHKAALACLRAAARPIAAPSANRSGRVSPTTAAHVAAELGARVALILDGGACRVGVESSVVDLSGPVARLLRPGGVAREAIEARIGPLAAPAGQAWARGRPKGPGMQESHYAPRLRLRLGVKTPRASEAYLAFGPVAPGVTAKSVINLSPTRDLEEAAARLFASLRALDRRRFSAIAVAPIPAHGLGLAINDRLKRAAAPRSR